MIILYHISLTIKDCCGQSVKYHRKKLFSKYLMLFLLPFHHQTPILIFSFWNEKLLNFLCMTHRVHQQKNQFSINILKTYFSHFTICYLQNKTGCCPSEASDLYMHTAAASHHLIRTSFINKTDLT